MKASEYEGGNSIVLNFRKREQLSSSTYAYWQKIARGLWEVAWETTGDATVQRLALTREGFLLLLLSF